MGYEYGILRMAFRGFVTSASSPFPFPSPFPSPAGLGFAFAFALATGLGLILGAMRAVAAVEPILESSTLIICLRGLLLLLGALTTLVLILGFVGGRGGSSASVSLPLPSGSMSILLMFGGAAVGFSFP